MTSGTMGLGPCPIPNEAHAALPMLRPASCDARRLRRSAAWPARIGADADESAAAVCAASPAAQGASDRDERPHGSSAIAAHRLRCGMRLWMHGRAIGLQAGAPSVRCLHARRSTVPIPGPSVYALRYPSAGWCASCRCARPCRIDSGDACGASGGRWARSGAPTGVGRHAAAARVSGMARIASRMGRTAGGRSSAAVGSQGDAHAKLVCALALRLPGLPSDRQSLLGLAWLDRHRSPGRYGGRSIARRAAAIGRGRPVTAAPR